MRESTLCTIMCVLTFAGGVISLFHGDGMFTTEVVICCIGGCICRAIEQK